MIPSFQSRVISGLAPSRGALKAMRYQTVCLTRVEGAWDGATTTRSTSSSTVQANTGSSAIKSQQQVCKKNFGEKAINLDGFSADPVKLSPCFFNYQSKILCWKYLIEHFTSKYSFFCDRNSM